MFSPCYRQRAELLHGIDLEQSYLELLREIRLGGPVFHALLSSMNTPELGITRCQGLVLERMAAGHSFESAGADLLIGRETVKSHLSEARRRLVARNTTHAVAMAIRAGLILPPGPESKGRPIKRRKSTP